MRLNPCRHGILWFGLLLLAPMLLSAQPDEVGVVGSGIATPLFEALAAQADVELDYTTTITGTSQGLEAFCDGEAEVATATRPMTLDEEQRCEANGVEFGEFVMGYSAVVFITHPDLSFLSCATTNELSTALAPSSVQYETWAEALGSTEAEAGIRAFLPGPDTLAYVLADEVLSGVGFRADAETVAEPTALVQQVRETPGAIGLVGLSELEAAEGVQVVELRNNEIRRCVTPSPETVGDGAYPAGTPLLAYANLVTLADDEGVAAAFDTMASQGSRETVSEQGFAPPTSFDYTTNRDLIVGDAVGRQFSRALTDFQIPPTVLGAVNIGGAAAAFNLLDNVATSFSQQYADVTVNINMFGEPAGERELCNGEIDMIATYSAPSEGLMENCEAADITLYDLEIGEQATVLVANEAADYLACMTTDEIVTTWQAASADEVLTWADVNSDYPTEAFVLFAGNAGNPIPNLMMRQAAGANVPLRVDTESDTDPLYRAAATANVETALTYMSWDQYQDVLNNEQERIQVVAVDGGEGCIVPSEETIQSGAYPLMRSLHLVMSESSLQRIEVQSYLWFLFQDDRFSDFQQNNFDLMTLKGLFDIRTTLQNFYTAAQQASVTVTEEAPAEVEAETETDEE